MCTVTADSCNYSTARSGLGYQPYMRVLTSLQKLFVRCHGVAKMGLLSPSGSIVLLEYGAQGEPIFAGKMGAHPTVRAWVTWLHLLDGSPLMRIYKDPPSSDIKLVTCICISTG